MDAGPLSLEELSDLNAYFRAANYLAAGQIYLLDNPLLREPLKLEDIKPRLLGHWGTTPGLNFIYLHCNRMIKKFDLDMIFVTGPGHGAPAILANVYMEGSYSDIYPQITQDKEGIKKFFKQFSFPGGIPSHTAPETPGSINEGGELGYSLAHAYGAAFDNPDLIVTCVVGDGEAETGPLAASWHSNKFLNPITDGAVLPILHLNGYKIANPTLLARISHEELKDLFVGYGYHPYFVEGSDPYLMHQLMAETMQQAIEEIKRIQIDARTNGFQSYPKWPVIILRSPKGWTGPQEVDGKKIEGHWRAHQVPITKLENPEHLKILEHWLRSYKPEELFDEDGRLFPQIAQLAPKNNRRMGSNPHANGGLLLKELHMPDFRDFAIDVAKPGSGKAESARILGFFLEEIMRLNLASKNFRVMGPDETTSNRLDAIYHVTGRVFTGPLLADDENISHHGRVMEILSEHLCQGWLEGYILTGRHGLFSCYEAFIHIVDSMFNQHAKWLKSARDLIWRRPIASLNYFLTSHVWRQDHNGFSHQDPGFLDLVVNKKAEVIRVYLPPDANCLLSVANHCLNSKDYINVIVAGKQPALQYLNMNEAERHCEKGIGIWRFASNDRGVLPDVVMACAGDVPTLETLAAIDILRKKFPELKIRCINVVDLMVLQSPSEHPHGLSDAEFDDLFPVGIPIIFAFHGYPTLIHRLTYRRNNHNHLHVRGYKEEGTTTTPFDMVVLNDLDRFHLANDAVRRLEKLANMRAYFSSYIEEQLFEHKRYIQTYGDDVPAIKNWQWPDEYTNHQ